jgi:hypothetical protein
MKAERITDYFVTVIPEAVDVNDVDAFAALREEMQRQVEVMLLRQYERPPKALMLEPTEWLVTDSPDAVEAFQPEHDCAECRAGNQRACEFPALEAAVHRLRHLESCARSLLYEHRDDPGGTGEETLFDVLAEILGAE